MRRILTIAAAALLAGCSTALRPPSVSVADQGIEPATGRYAVVLQNGGWSLKVRARTYKCSAFSFDLDLNGSYGSAMRAVVGRAMRDFELVGRPLPPAELKPAGYDAMVVVHQTGATSAYELVPGLLFETGAADMSLSVIVAVIDQQGLVFQQQVNASGSGKTGGVFSCGDIGQAVFDSAKIALGGLVRSADAELRKGLAKRASRIAAKPYAPLPAAFTPAVDETPPAAAMANFPTVLLPPK